MINWTFTAWCRKATGLIRFSPDREAVSRELRDHLQDHYDARIAQGCSPEEATQAALNAMGDPEEIAPQLAALHKPFWGHVERLCRLILILSVITLVVVGWLALMTAVNKSYTEIDNPWYTDTNETHFSYKMLGYTEPNATQSDSGYRLTVTRAAAWKIGTERIQIYCDLEVRKLTPWADLPDIDEHIWAIDDLGNYYCTMLETFNRSDEQHYIIVSETQTGPMTVVYEISMVNPSDVAPQWVELHYSRDGRDLIWRIDLAGGDNQ